MVAAGAAVEADWGDASVLAGAPTVASALASSTVGSFAAKDRGPARMINRREKEIHRYLCLSIKRNVRPLVR